MYYTQPDSIAPGLSSSRFGGMDARAAMIPGGLVDGVSSLAQALLQAPMQRRQMELRAKQAQEESDFRKAQIDNMRAQQQLNQTRTQNESDWHKNQLDEQRRYHDQENARKGVEDLGTGIKNAWTLANQSVGSFLKGSNRGGAPTREAVISPYLEVDSAPDTYGHTHKVQRLKTQAEMDAERNARSYLKVGGAPAAPTPGAAPAASVPVIAPEHRAGEARVTQAIPDLSAQVSEYVKRARDPNDLAQLRADIASGNVENVQARLGQMASARPQAPDPAAPPPDYSHPAYP